MTTNIKRVLLLYPDSRCVMTDDDGVLPDPPHHFRWTEITDAPDAHDNIRSFVATPVMNEDASAIKPDPDHALHDSKGKPHLSLIPEWPLWLLATVYEYGTQKYAKDDWRAGHDYSEWYESCKRHLGSWWEGEENDAESGLPHLAHAAWCVFTLMWQERYRKQWDNRPKAEDVDANGAKYKDIADILHKMRRKYAKRD